MLAIESEESLTDVQPHLVAMVLVPENPQLPLRYHQQPHNSLMSYLPPSHQENGKRARRHICSMHFLRTPGEVANFIDRLPSRNHSSTVVSQRPLAVCLKCLNDTTRFVFIPDIEAFVQTHHKPPSHLLFHLQQAPFVLEDDKLQASVPRHISCYALCGYDHINPMTFDQSRLFNGFQQLPHVVWPAEFLSVSRTVLHDCFRRLGFRDDEFADNREMQAAVAIAMWSHANPGVVQDIRSADLGEQYDNHCKLIKDSPEYVASYSEQAVMRETTRQTQTFTMTSPSPGSRRLGGATATFTSSAERTRELSYIRNATTAPPGGFISSPVVHPRVIFDEFQTSSQQQQQQQQQQIRLSPRSYRALGAERVLAEYPDQAELEKNTLTPLRERMQTQATARAFPPPPAAPAAAAAAAAATTTTIQGGGALSTVNTALELSQRHMVVGIALKRLGQRGPSARMSPSALVVAEPVQVCSCQVCTQLTRYHKGHGLPSMPCQPIFFGCSRCPGRLLFAMKEFKQARCGTCNQTHSLQYPPLFQDAASNQSINSKPLSPPPVLVHASAPLGAPPRLANNPLELPSMAFAAEPSPFATASTPQNRVPSASRKRKEVSQEGGAPSTNTRGHGYILWCSVWCKARLKLEGGGNPRNMFPTMSGEWRNAAQSEKDIWQKRWEELVRIAQAQNHPKPTELRFQMPWYQRLKADHPEHQFD